VPAFDLARTHTLERTVDELMGHPSRADGTDEGDEYSVQRLEATRRNSRPVSIETLAHRGAAGGLHQSASPRKVSVERRFEKFAA
jgi:hypothetical protein